MPRRRLQPPHESGELEDIAKVYFATDGAEWRAERVDLIAEVYADAA